MHWNRILQEKLSQLPDSLKSRCIDYKLWKKSTKSSVLFDDFIIVELYTTCKRVDKVFQRIFSDLHDKISLSKCIAWISFCSEKEKYTVEELLIFAQINKTTVYKICKRIDKRINRRGDKGNALSWLCDMKMQHKFQFMGGAKLTVLEMTANSTTPIECPICLENVDQVVVSHCGHYMCLECVFSLCKIQNRYTGYLYNILSFRDKTICPMCRAWNPFENFMVIPHTSSKFLHIDGVIY